MPQKNWSRCARLRIHLLQLQEKEMGKKETKDLKTKIKLCIVTSIVAAFIVAVWGLLANLMVLYHLQEVSNCLTMYDNCRSHHQYIHV